VRAPFESSPDAAPRARLRARDQAGAAAVEFALLVPALLLMIGLVLGAGRLAYARVSVQQVADSAARAASQARDPSTARADAQEVAALYLEATGVGCAGGPGGDVATAGLAVPGGQPARVGVRVSCAVALADLALPGFPGDVTVTAEAGSPLDRYRGRR